MSYHNRIFLYVSLIFSFINGAIAHGKKTTIKFAIITPKGSTWSNVLHEFAKETKKQTNGNVKFKIYAGGIIGDENAVLSKISRNIVHGGGFSGVGLGTILPEIRILESPTLFQNDKEIDEIKNSFYPYFEKKFSEKNFELLGFAEAGFVYLFSKQKIATAASLKKTKMWVWKGDAVAENFLQTFNIPAIPLDVSQVYTGLATNMIDSFYAPPLAALAFQWGEKVKYMMKFQFVNSIGALLIHKKAFAKLSPTDQAIVKKLGTQYCNKIVSLTRSENAAALQSLKAKFGINFLDPSPSDIAQFKKNAIQTNSKNAGKVYPKELYNKITKNLALLRSKAK